MERYLQPATLTIEHGTVTIGDRILPFVAQRNCEENSQWRLHRLPEVTKIPTTYRAVDSQLWYVRTPRESELILTRPDEPIARFLFDAPIMAINPYDQHCWVVLEHRASGSSASSTSSAFVVISLVETSGGHGPEHLLTGRYLHSELLDEDLVVELEIFDETATPQWFRQQWKVSPSYTRPIQLETARDLHRPDWMHLPDDYRRDLPTLDANGNDVHRLLQLSQQSPRAAVLREQNGIVIWPLPGDEVAHSVLLDGRLGQSVESNDSLYCIVHTVHGSKLVRHRRNTDQLETLLDERELPLSNLQGLVPAVLSKGSLATVLKTAHELTEALLTGWVTRDGKRSGPIQLHYGTIESVEITDGLWPRSEISVTYQHRARPGITFVRHISVINEIGEPAVGDPLVSLIEDLDTGRIPPESLYRFDRHGRVVTYDYPRASEEITP
jgi:hypothetical protein